MPEPLGTTALTPGFMIVHGNRLDDLRDLAVSWMRRYPLAPLESERVLVHSNGIAQWLKLALAEDPREDGGGGGGIAAALEVQLPAQFLWQAYRAVLGRESIPEVSELDKAPLTWRLMRLLPGLLERPEFRTLQRFLADDADLRKRHQLAERLADLFDQYQVYRGDWLDDWSQGRDQLRTANGQARPLGADERWQAELWRALLADVGADSLARSRSGVHRRFIEALRSASAARARCRDEWWCSGFPRCRRRPSRRWPPWPGSARCCSACTTPVATTGPTSSPTRTCCATSTAASSAAPASPPTSTRTASTSMPSRCWRPGASRAATTSTCSTATTTRTAIGTCSARSTAGASTCSARRPRTGCSASCRTISSNCARWRKPASTGRRWRSGATPRSASMWPTARSAKWRSSTTSCSPASTPIRA